VTAALLNGAAMLNGKSGKSWYQVVGFYCWVIVFAVGSDGFCYLVFLA
jgi:hypothetical protein